MLQADRPNTLKKKKKEKREEVSKRAALWRMWWRLVMHSPLVRDS